MTWPEGFYPSSSPHSTPTCLCQPVTASSQQQQQHLDDTTTLHVNVPLPTTTTTRREARVQMYACGSFLYLCHHTMDSDTTKTTSSQPQQQHYDTPHLSCPIQEHGKDEEDREHLEHAQPGMWDVFEKGPIGSWRGRQRRGGGFKHWWRPGEGKRMTR